METMICKVHLSHLRKDFPVIEFNQPNSISVNSNHLKSFSSVSFFASCLTCSLSVATGLWFVVLQVSSPLKLLGPRCKQSEANSGPEQDTLEISSGYDQEDQKNISSFRGLVSVGSILLLALC